MDYQDLVKNLIKQGYLKTPLIIEVFKNIDRADFVPAELKDEAGVDAPLPIGWGQTISQPLTVAFMLELLQPEPGDKILDVGSGSGWTSALLGKIVREMGENRGDKGNGLNERKGIVFAIERIPEICEFGKKNISKYNFIKQGIVKLACVDGGQGMVAEAPFDKILVSAAAEKIPEELKRQLKVSGRLVVPVQSSILLIIREAEEKFSEKEFYGFSFVPLING